MLRLSKKSNFPTKLFIAASLAVFILFVFLFLLIKISFLNNNIITYSQKPSTADKYYFNKNYNESDPFITKVPTLKDMLAGPIISKDDPSLGRDDALITIVEFSDYECSFCQKQEQILKEVINQYKGKIRLIWKDYPINNQNSVSYQSAIAARCAQKQNQFWAYHDLLYKNSASLNQKTYLKLAKKINLDLTKFNNCLSNNNIKELINNNIKEANALDINGVPFVYINDQEIMGQITVGELKKIIELELNKN